MILEVMDIQAKTLHKMGQTRDKNSKHEDAFIREMIRFENMAMPYLTG